MGRADCVHNSYLINNQSFHAVIEPTLEDLTQRFWELESVPTKKHLSPDDEACERIFKETFSRDDTGRYTVALPFKYEPTELGRSENIARTRLLNLEKRLNSNPELRIDYNATIQDYIEKGYLNKIDNPAPGPCYYIPHKAIYRPDKATTKTRIVLDASCKTSSSKSLNDVLYTGPNLQTNIFDLLINLRLFSIALSADIEKMFFQLNLNPRHHSFQRILFRFNSDEPIATYAFSRIAFGLSSSPYLAMRVVRQLADDERTRWPAAAWAADRHFFMDDYVSSVSSVSEAERLYHELTQLFKAGGFKLVKWVTNKNIKIPRHVGILQHSRNISLIGFADASEKCYGAAIYLRASQSESDVGQVTLLCAKSKVASSNNIVTLPRLELCAALLLSNLIVAVRDSISERIPINETVAFSDSTVTLSWIRAPPFRFQTFVANRISAINENLPARHWFHIAGNENPADIISRPVMPSKLVDNDLWFHGPSWLARPLNEWPIQAYANPLPVIELPETKTSTFAVQPIENDSDVLYDLVQSYWHRWRVEYLTSLQSRQKWNTPSEPIEKGQIVIVKDDNAPVLSWPLAIIEELYPGRDQISRVAKIRTKTGSYVRPIVKLFKLPLQ
ncbi:hypothetical protein OBRU01_04287 [Operophtera brumata]|uniref:Uncharacterized protein n=1 Tax=Operophtera brumata TaxID=104452 RepID=A0A0L7LID1_OPEBR|nr:hypothetical protein OBRU01_04288 [Operophtera brumata]KOB75195.1 hypothetical protein OBRU01_04287 [Operophtera brumata]